MKVIHRTLQDMTEFDSDTKREPEVILGQITACAANKIKGDCSLAYWMEVASAAGLDEEDIKDAAIDGGYNPSSVGTELSRMRCKAGNRQRGKGAGRTRNADAVILAEAMLSKDADTAKAVLSAAARYIVKDGNGGFILDPEAAAWMEEQRAKFSAPAEQAVPVLAIAANA